jgi:predicted metal-binding protein
MMRYPEHAVGVNMIKTAERAGSSLKFPFNGKPERTGLLLID